MAARSTWEISAAIPVLYTHQKAVKRPSFKEGILRLSAGRATLCDSSGKVLDAETVTSSLLAQLKNQEELDFPGHLLQPDPTLEISVPSLPTEPEPSPSRRRGQTCLGVKPFKRPRTQPRSLSSFSTASSAAHSLPRPGRDEQDLSGALSAPSTVKNLGDESKATPTPCRQRLDLQGAGTRFRPPRPAPKWRDESEFKPNGPGLPGQREAFAPDHQEAEALALALRRAEAAPEQAEAQVLELCRQEVHTFRRAHLELDQQEEEARVLERQQEEALALDQHREAEAEVLWQQRLCDVQQALALDQHREAEAEVLWQQRLCDVQQAHVLERQQEEALALDPHRQAEAEVLEQQRSCALQEARFLERQQEEALALDQQRQAEAEAHFLARQQEEALALDQQRQAEAEAHFLERQQEEALALDQHRQAEAEAHFLERQQEEALQQRRSYALQEEQALELRQQEAHDAACQAQQRQPEAPALEPALQRQNEAFVLNPQQAEELRQQQERAIEEALAWERQAQAKPHGEALDRREQEDEDESGPQEDMEDEPESEAALSPDEEDLPLMEVMAKQEEDLPLAGMVAAQAKANGRPPRKAKAKTPVVPLKLPLSFGSVPESAPREDLSAEAGHAAYFEHLLVSEMQRRLGALASGAEKPSLVASGVMLGAAKDDGGLAVLLFSRAKILQGDLGCAQNDLWAVRLGREGGPEILLRALWKGVTPKGRLLCAPVNQAASEYLESHRSRRLCRTSLTLCCGAFGELLQVGALRADPKRAAVLQSTSPASASLPELPELQGLSEEQREVARRVAAWCDGAQGCVPVRGVFGSGKSRTLAACIVLLDRLLSERNDPRRIVLLCQTNVAVDGVLLRLLNHGWDRFVRLGSFKAMAPQLLSCGAGLAKERKVLVKDFSEALKHQVGLDEPTAQALRQSVERGELPPRPSVWRKRRVLATTLAALEAADHLGEALRCPLVLVDEAAQLTEPQLFAALSRVSAECVLLLGDPRQLPPRAAHSSLQLSALARLPPQLELTTQFRCHPDIGELCSQLFYGGRLKSGVSKEARGSVLGPNHSALAVVLSQGLECRVGQSFRHDAEARLCTAWLLQARASGLRAQDFGIICLYRAHAEACASAARAGDLQVEAATVDAFQGGEREVIALCCGRSSPVSGDSFTCCPFRLLVALSRARRHVVIFGTESFLSSHPIFSQILAFAAAKGAVVRP